MPKQVPSKLSRKGLAAATLRKEGYSAVNAGGFGERSAAGLSVLQP